MRIGYIDFFLSTMSSDRQGLFDNSMWKRSGCDPITKNFIEFLIEFLHQVLCWVYLSRFFFFSSELFKKKKKKCDSLTSGFLALRKHASFRAVTWTAGMYASNLGS